MQHDIGNPKLQRRCLPLLQDAIACGEVPRWQMAMLADCIRVLEGKAQVYGTQYDWDEFGEMSPLPVEEPERINALSQSVGLMSLEEDIRQKRARLAEPRKTTRRHGSQKGKQGGVGTPGGWAGLGNLILDVVVGTSTMGGAIMSNIVFSADMEILPKRLYKDDASPLTEVH